jgi:hypothetical protein
VTVVLSSHNRRSPTVTGLSALQEECRPSPFTCTIFVLCCHQQRTVDFPNANPTELMLLQRFSDSSSNCVFMRISLLGGSREDLILRACCGLGFSACRGVTQHPRTHHFRFSILPFPTYLPTYLPTHPKPYPSTTYTNPS